MAAVCLIASIISLLSLTRWHGRYSDVEIGLLAVDMATLTMFVAVALHSDRFWPLWVAGLQLTTSMGHLLKAMESDLLPVAYGAALRMWSYPILLILLIGTWRGRQRQLREASPA